MSYEQMAYQYTILLNRKLMHLVEGYHLVNDNVGEILDSQSIANLLDNLDKRN